MGIFSSLSKGLLSGAESLGSGLLGGAVDLAQNALFTNWQYNHDSNMLEQQKNNQLALQEQSAKLSQQNWLEQFAKQRQYQDEQWNRSNAYNTPAAQVRRLMEAGINPAAYLAGGSGLQSSVSSPMSATSPAGGIGSPGSAGIVSSRGYGGSFSQSALALEQAKGHNITNKNLEDKIQSEIKKNLSTAESQDSIAALNTLESQLKAMKAPYEVQRMIADVRHLMSKAALVDEQAATEIHRRALMKSEEILNYARSNLTDKQRAVIEEQLPYVAEQARSDIAESKARASEYSAGAELKHEQAVTERVIRPLEKVSRTLVNGIQALKFDYDRKTLPDRIAKVSRELEQAGLQNRLLVQQIERAYKDNRVFYVRFVADMLQSAASSFRDVGIGANQFVQAYMSVITKGLSAAASAKDENEARRVFDQYCKKNGVKPADSSDERPFDDWFNYVQDNYNRIYGK